MSDTPRLAAELPLADSNPSTPEEAKPIMLDVHPPHAPTHTWKDFLIHIATIVDAEAGPSLRSG